MYNEKFKESVNTKWREKMYIEKSLSKLYWKKCIGKGVEKVYKKSVIKVQEKCIENILADV